MKIAFVYDAVYPYITGGAEKRVYELGRNISREGHEVHWFGVKWWEGDLVTQMDGITLHGVCDPLRLYSKTGRRSISEALLFSLKLFRHLMREDFDIIDCQQFPYLPCFTCKIVSVIKRKPLVINWLEVWGRYWLEYLGWKGFFGVVVEKACIRLTPHNISISERTRNRLIESGASPGNVEVVPGGIDIREIDKIKPSDEKYDVIFAGRLIKDKNVDILIKSLGGENIRVAIIGEGPELDKLKSIAEPNITFLPFQEHSKLISYIKSTRIFVSPSTREGFGITVLEALACGKPVITVRHPCNAASDLIVDGVNGFLVDVSEEGIRDKVVALMEDTDRWHEMSGECRKSAGDYDWKALSDKALLFYEKFLNR